MPGRPKGERPVARARGRVLDRRDIQNLQKFIARRKQLTLREIALELAKLWNWRRPNGELREQASSKLLLRLARRGELRLPPQLQRHLRVRRRARERRSAWSGLTECFPWPALPDPSPEGKGGLMVRPITPGEHTAWDQFMASYHYLGRPELVGESLRYAAFFSGQVVGLLAWAAAALKCRPRDRYIGWDEAARIENLHLVLNNVRFLMLSGGGERNLASRVLSANLRRLSKDWEAVYSHPIYLAETFVDPSRFRGTCYRAANWLVLGETQGWSKHGMSYRHHGQRKLVLVYPLRPQARELLRSLRSPWSNEEEVKRTMSEVLDVEKLPLDGEGGLFEVLGRIADPRKRRGVRHPLHSVLALAACAVLCGARNIGAIAQWAAYVRREVRLKLGNRRKRPPSEPTFRRLLRGIGVESLERLVGEWFSKQRDLRGKGVALDGKTLRGSVDGQQPAAHLVSLESHEDGLVLGEVRVADKTNEITAAIPLVEPVALDGAVVTADAMHAQKETARYLVEEKKADYLFVVKENQRTLLEDIKLLGLGDFSPSGGDGEQGARSPGDSQDPVEPGARQLRGLPQGEPSLPDRADPDDSRQRDP